MDNPLDLEFFDREALQRWILLCCQVNDSSALLLRWLPTVVCGSQDCQ